MPDFCGLPGCGVEVEEGGRCSRCKAIVYCGVAHQKEDWGRHRAACGEIKAARTEESNAFTKLVGEAMGGVQASTPSISSKDLKMLREQMGDKGLEEAVETVLKMGYASNRQEVLKNLVNTARGAEEAEKKRQEQKLTMAGGSTKGCAGCGRKAKHPKRCTGCYLEKYCNKKCQNKAWPGHKAACRELRAQYRPVNILPMNDVDKMVLKMLGKGLEGTSPTIAKEAVKKLLEDRNKVVKSQFTLLVRVDMETGVILVNNEGNSVYGELDRSSGQEATYDKLMRDVPKLGVKGCAGLYRAFYYALYYEDADKNGGHHLEINVEKPVAMQLWT